MKRIITLLAVVSLLLAQKKKVRFDESFDPATLKEPEIKLPVILKPDEPLPPQFSPVETDTVVEGYRVQVISTQDLKEAGMRCMLSLIRPTIRLGWVISDPGVTLKRPGSG